MIRAAAATGVIAALLACGACSQAPAEPVPVAEDFRATVAELLRAVDPAAEPEFGAQACGAWPSTPDQVVTFADASVAGVDAARLREAALAAGWQPQVSDSADLALVGPHDVLLALTGEKVRAERSGCTTPVAARTFDHNDFARPDPTGAQASAVAEGQARARRTAEVVEGVLRGGGRQAPDPALANCGGAGPRGVTWTLRQTATLPAGTDLPDLLSRVDDALRADGLTTKRGPEGVEATGGGIAVVVGAREPSTKDVPVTFRLDVRPDGCVPVAGP
ncbi:hypothetical protein ACFPM7_01265 [Actinokineospora guangxiensis]|uniref:PASTA domain-containing protein n=1 Tax=Actinokineospora guangxiensis TaxID=1490288 RepID=A0ABW0EFC4_9PSEU